MTVHERMQSAIVLRPEVASMNMGAMNLGWSRMLPRFKAFNLETAVGHFIAQAKQHEH